MRSDAEILHECYKYDSHKSHVLLIEINQTFVEIQTPVAVLTK